MSEIHVTLHRESMHRWPCAICQESTDKDAVQASFRLFGDDADDYGAHRHRVCADCLAAGPDAVPSRLEKTARSLDAWAADLRMLAKEQWSLPTVAEWREANASAYREMEEMYGL
jgi:hypothetical protein